MRDLLSALVVCLVAVAGAHEARSAPLNVFIAAPLIEIPTARAYYYEGGGIADLMFLGEEGLAMGIPQTDALIVNLSLYLDPFGPPFGGIYSFDGDGAFLEGGVLRTGFRGSVLQVLFDDLTGQAAGYFGAFALLELEFVSPTVGTNPLTHLVKSTAYEVRGTVYGATPIPAPAGLSLVGAALYSLLFLRRRH